MEKSLYRVTVFRQPSVRLFGCNVIVLLDVKDFPDQETAEDFAAKAIDCGLMLDGGNEDIAVCIQPVFE